MFVCITRISLNRGSIINNNNNNNNNKNIYIALILFRFCPGGGGGTSLLEASGNVSLDEVAFSQLV